MATSYLRPLPAPPAATGWKGLAVRFGYPDGGWIDIAFQDGAQSCAFAVSFVFDPVWELMAWLAGLMDADEYPRIIIDREGHFAELVVYPYAEHEVQFVIWLRDADDLPEMNLDRRPRDPFDEDFVGVPNGNELHLNITIGRRDLIWAFYRSIVEFWPKRRDDPFWDHWYNRTDPQRHFFHPVRSREIEEWLGWTPA